jgi:hypothetical protein
MRGPVEVLLSQKLIAWKPAEGGSRQPGPVETLVVDSKTCVITIWRLELGGGAEAAGPTLACSRCCFFHINILRSLLYVRLI